MDYSEQLRMAKQFAKIGLGGGCHWCTEAVFQSIIGVLKVEQGFVATAEHPENFSEAVIVHFNSAIITLKELIDIHLHTHSSTKNHTMRSKYRSAVYVNDVTQKSLVNEIIKKLAYGFEDPVITKAHIFGSFKPSLKQFQNYYLKNPQKPFCKAHIKPKMGLLMRKFSTHFKN